MSAVAGRAASKVGQAATKAAGKAAESGSPGKKQSVLQKGARKDPELYVYDSRLITHSSAVAVG